MAKTIAVIAFGLILLCLIALSIVYQQPAKAQYQGNVTINADGSIIPASAPIQKTGNTYTLTSDVYGSITVYRNNINLNGNGHALYGQGNTPLGFLTLNQTSSVTVKNLVIPYSVNTGPQEIGIYLVDASNTLVVNNTITGFESEQAWNGGTYAAISVAGGASNIIVGNNFEQNLFGMFFAGTSNNKVIGNNIVGNTSVSLFSTGIFFSNASDNTIYHNNIIDNNVQVDTSASINIWDNGYPSGGNYWSDYQTKYPNATEIDGSGIGNTPYAIDANNTDYYPLLSQVDISKLVPPSTSLQTVSSPTVTVPELSWLAIVPLLLSVFAVAVIIRHRKTVNLSSRPFHKQV